MVSIAGVQSIVAILALLSISILQFISLGKLEEKYSATKAKLTRSAIISLISFIILSIFSWFFVFKTGAQGGFIDYTVLTTAGVLLLVTGGYGADAALDLQCDKDINDSVHTAWSLSMVSSLVGVVGAVLMLVVQIILKRSVLTQKICPECKPCQPCPPRNPPPVSSTELKKDFGNVKMKDMSF